jgi:hypothetical protein
MKQEDKDLLLKDICSRLPYGVKVQHQHQDYLNEVQTIEKISKKYGEIETESILGFVDDFKPYLFPLSSMTEEIMNEIYTNTGVYDINIDSSVHIEVGTTFEALTKISDILNKYHIDYKGLIPKDLAIDATNLNIY